MLADIATFGWFGSSDLLSVSTVGWYTSGVVAGFTVAFAGAGYIQQSDFGVAGP